MSISRSRFSQLLPFNTAKVIRGVGGIASAEAFGSATINPLRTVTLAGIASAEAFGSPALKYGPIALTGIPSAEAFGSAHLTYGPIALTGIASAEAVGTPTLTTAGSVSLAGIASAEAFGSPALKYGPITLAGIASAEAFGSAHLTYGPITFSGIVSGEAFGSAALSQPRTITLTGIPSAEAFGDPDVSLLGAVLRLSGIPSAETFGHPTVRRFHEIVEVGAIPSAEAFGGLRIARFHEVDLLGIPSAEAFGALHTRYAPITLIAIPSAEAFGTPAINRSIRLTGIPSAEAFGALRLSGDIRLIGIPSAEAFGRAILTGGTRRYPGAPSPKPMRFFVVVRPPLTGRGSLELSRHTLTIPIDADITKLDITTSLPGGFNTCNIGFRDRGQKAGRYGALSEPADIPWFAHVEVYAGSALIFEGRVVKRNRPGGRVMGVLIQGYGFTGMQDGLYPGNSAVTNTLNADTPTDLILREAILQGSAVLSPGPVFEETRLNLGRGNFGGQTPAQIAEAVGAHGGAYGPRYDAYVYEDRLVNFRARRAPDRPDYIVPFDDTVDWDEDASGVYGKVSATGATELAVEELADFADRFGITRETQISSDTLNGRAFLSSWLAKHGRPIVAATVSRDRNRGLETPGGSPVPAWLVRSDGWVQVGTEPMLPIVSTRWSGNTGEASFELGEPAPTLANTLKKLRRTANHFKTATDPNTGLHLRNLLSS